MRQPNHLFRWQRSAALMHDAKLIDTGDDRFHTLGDPPKAHCGAAAKWAIEIITDPFRVQQNFH